MSNTWDCIVCGKIDNDLVECCYCNASKAFAERMTALIDERIAAALERLAASPPPQIKRSEVFNGYGKIEDESLLRELATANGLRYWTYSLECGLNDVLDVNGRVCYVADLGELS